MLSPSGALALGPMQGRSGQAARAQAGASEAQSFALAAKKGAVPIRINEVRTPKRGARCEVGEVIRDNWLPCQVLVQKVLLTAAPHKFAVRH